ncbi:Lysine-specific demethylase 4A [Bulinus truncatus]|nr:Lysine-specific demethylase 4A [Bulinus truncatus]
MPDYTENDTLTSEVEVQEDSQSEVRQVLSFDGRNIFILVNHVALSNLISLFGIGANVVNIVVFFRQGLRNSTNLSFFLLAITDFMGLLTQLACLVRITGWITVYSNGAERCLSIAIPLKIKQIVTFERTSPPYCFLHLHCQHGGKQPSRRCGFSAAISLGKSRSGCYGELNCNSGSEWTCTVCKQQKVDQIYCHVCCLRGGALKPTTDGRWAHIICTLVIGDASFVNARARAPINIANITASRYKLKCSFCSTVSSTKMSHTTACVQCSFGRCTKSFHVTCGYAAGAKFEISDWPIPIYVSCLKHVSSHNRTEGRHLEQLQDLKEGDIVVAKHKNRRYYWARVIDVCKKRLYEVDFDDGSFSEDLLPEDIEGRDCLKDGPPEKGEHVRIKWTDGAVYGATFRKVNIQDLYTIEFEDSSQLQAKREELWAETEEIPKYVKNRMSEATDSKFEITQVKPEGKRMKKIVNYKLMGKP